MVMRSNAKKRVLDALRGPDEWLSVGQLVKRTNLREHQVRDAIQELEPTGEIVARPGPDGQLFNARTPLSVVEEETVHHVERDR